MVVNFISKIDLNNIKVLIANVIITLLYSIIYEVMIHIMVN